MKLSIAEENEIRKLAAYDVEQEIGWLIRDICEGVKPDSPEDVLGMEKLQARIASNLLDLAEEVQKTPEDEALPRKICGTVRAALYGFKKFRQRVWGLQHHGTLEEYLRRHLDLKDDEYYLPPSEEEVKYKGTATKPLTVDELMTHRSRKENHQIRKTDGIKLYGDAYHVYGLPERVGFDRMQFQVRITDVDFAKLEHAIVENQRQNYLTLPRIVADHVDPRDISDRPLYLCGYDTHSFKRIEVTLSHHVRFLFQRSNIPRNHQDIYLLETTVVPEEGHEVLGNIGNYDYVSMVQVVRQAMADLEELTGITLDQHEILLNQVELNLSFVMHCKFEHLLRTISFYQVYAREGYTTEEFKAQDEGLVTFLVSDGECETEEEYKAKAKKITRKYNRMKLTGLKTSTKTLTVKIYDKKEETVKAAESQGIKLDMDVDVQTPTDEYTIVRLEFGIINQNQIMRYFHTRYLGELSQKHIEDCYKGLVQTFFGDAYEEYAAESHEILKDIVRGLDTSRGSDWKSQLLKSILTQEIWMKATPALLSENDITDDILRANPTFAKHPRKYRGEIRDLLRESEEFRRGQEEANFLLINFLNRVGNLETLSPKRRIGYVVVHPEKSV